MRELPKKGVLTLGSSVKSSPASRTNICKLGSSDSLVASASPAVPPPTITTSKTSDIVKNRNMASSTKRASELERLIRQFISSHLAKAIR